VVDKINKRIRALPRIASTSQAFCGAMPHCDKQNESLPSRTVPDHAKHRRTYAEPWSNQ
jgi:hypothetical protein